MSFTKVYSDLLFPFVESYKAAENEKTRAQVVTKAADMILLSSHLLEDHGVSLPKDLKTVCLFFMLYHSPLLFTSSGHHSIY